MGGPAVRPPPPRPSPTQLPLAKPRRTWGPLGTWRDGGAEPPGPTHPPTGAGDRGKLTFSLETWWEKGQVPSVFLHVPRTNLGKQGGSEGRGVRASPHPTCREAAAGAPGAHGHLLGVVDVGAVLAAVAPAEAVVVHAVLLLPPPPPLPRLPHDGQAALHGPAGEGADVREPRKDGEHPAPNPKGRTWPGSGCSCWQGPSGLWGGEAGHSRPTAPGSALSPLTCLAPAPWDAPPSGNPSWFPSRKPLALLDPCQATSQPRAGERPRREGRSGRG